VVYIIILFQENLLFLNLVLQELLLFVVYIILQTRRMLILILLILYLNYKFLIYYFYNKETIYLLNYYLYGAGKTGVFAIGALEKVDLNLKDLQVLIISPTREFVKFIINNKQIKTIFPNPILILKLKPEKHIKRIKRIW